MSDVFEVELEGFAGPLDLLLYLIKRDEVDVHDIPVAHIAGEYLTLLEAMEELDIRVGGEFLVVASMLLELKSQMTLVRHQSGGRACSKDQIDPRYELVRQLLEYRRTKDAAATLVELEDQQSQRFFHPVSASELRGPTGPPEPGYLRADLWDLVAAYGRMLNSLGTHHTMEIPYDDTPIEVYYVRLVEQIASGRVAFHECLGGGNRHELVGLFLALLELLKLRKVIATQDEAFGQIYLEPGPGLPEDDADDAIFGEGDEDEEDAFAAPDELPAPPDDPTLN